MKSKMKLSTVDSGSAAKLAMHIMAKRLENLGVPAVLNVLQRENSRLPLTDIINGGSSDYNQIIFWNWGLKKELK